MKPLFAVFAAAAALSLAGPAHAQTFREIMEDIGLQKREQANIDFSERAPLVMPPSTEALPPPEDKSALATVNPNWPNDPDVAAAARQAELEALPERERRKYQDNAAKAIYKIRAQEREQQSYGSGSTYETMLDRDRVMTPNELKDVQRKKAEEAKNAPAGATVYVEPERKRLTDPPPGYRQPSPDQPFGPGEAEKKRSNWLSKLNPFN